MSAVATGPRDLRDARRLADLEQVIERGRQTFIEVGAALLEIRESRLYRAEFATFEDYCRTRWGYGTSRVGQLMDAAKVAQVLGSTTVEVPSNEWQTRELVPLKDQPEALRSVWAGVVEQAEATETPVTAPIIRTAVRDYIRGQAATSEAEMREAASWMTEAERQAVAPEEMRQRGELMRLIADLGALPEPVAYAHRHGPHLDAEFTATAMAARGWLEFFCAALEGKR